MIWLSIKISSLEFDGRKCFRAPKIGDRFPKLPPSNQGMTAKLFGRRWHFSLATLLCALAMASLSFFQNSRAQTNKLVLISQETSTRALALDSVTLKREPFNSASDVSW